MTQQEFIDYFTHLAAAHRQIAHTAKKESFFYVEDELNVDEIEMAFRKRINMPAMLLMSPGGQLNDNAANNYTDDIEATFMIVDRAIEGPEIRQAKDKTKRIGMDVIARIRLDSKAGKIGTGRVHFAVSGVSYAPVDVVGLFVGYAFHLTLTCPFGFSVDSASWLDR